MESASAVDECWVGRKLGLGIKHTFIEFATFSPRLPRFFSTPSPQEELRYEVSVVCAKTPEDTKVDSADFAFNISKLEKTNSGLENLSTEAPTPHAHDLMKATEDETPRTAYDPLENNKCETPKAARDLLEAIQFETSNEVCPPVQGIEYEAFPLHDSLKNGHNMLQHLNYDGTMPTFPWMHNPDWTHFPSYCPEFHSNFCDSYNPFENMWYPCDSFMGAQTPQSSIEDYINQTQDPNTHDVMVYGAYNQESRHPGENSKGIRKQGTRHLNTHTVARGNDSASIHQADTAAGNGLSERKHKRSKNDRYTSKQQVKEQRTVQYVETEVPPPPPNKVVDNFIQQALHGIPSMRELQSRDFEAYRKSLRQKGEKSLQKEKNGDLLPEGQKTWIESFQTHSSATSCHSNSNSNRKYEEPGLSNGGYDVNRKHKDECAKLYTEAEERYFDANSSVSDEVIDHFLMYRFKTLECSIPKVHDWQTCPYAHTARDRRRDLETHRYGSEPCPQFQQTENVCPKGNRCPRSHGPTEYLYHPEVFRTLNCRPFMENHKCVRGRRCAYKHVYSDK